MKVTKEFLRNNPNYIFVFGDNQIHKGYKGAASLRDEPNSYGFITKKKPSFKDDAYFKPEEYHPIFLEELQKLELRIRSSVGTVWFISPIGSGLANKYNIWEKVIKKELEKLSEKYQNVRLLW